jgi:radical SAM-linked protein
MKARIKFQKYGSMKFVGHLDVMRYFQKLCRRANLDSEYTKGFSPHQIMSFAAPLGVGLTSDAEYVDVQLLSSDTPEVMVDRLNAAITEGFRVIDFHPLLDREDQQRNVTAMSLVASADYLVSLKDGYSISPSITTQEALSEAFQHFYEAAEIVIGKKTKTSEKEVNIKPMISFIAFNQQEYEKKARENLKEITTDISSSHNVEETADYYSEKPSVNQNFEQGTSGVRGASSHVKPESAADVYENGIKVYMQIDTGSSANLKPELVMEAFYDTLGIPFEKFAWQVHRLEVYTRVGDSGKLAALDQLDR